MKTTQKYFTLSLLILTTFSTLLNAAQPYFLNPKDTIEIKVIGHDELTIKQDITPDQTLSVPLVGRISTEGKTLTDLDQILKRELTKYIKNPQVVVLLTPPKEEVRTIFVVLYDQNKKTWEVKKTGSGAEALAYTANQSFSVKRNAQNLGPTTNIMAGDIITVSTGKAPDFFEENWYKLLTGTSVLLSIYNALHH